MRKAISFVLILAILLQGCASRSKLIKLQDRRTKSVVVEGIAPYAGDDIQASKVALNNAFKRAIERVVGVFVHAHSVTEKSKLTQEKIITDAKGYIEEYHIIKEGPKDRYYSVTIKAEVNLARIYDEFAVRTVNITVQEVKDPHKVYTVQKRIKKLKNVYDARMVSYTYKTMIIKVNLMDDRIDQLMNVIDNTSTYRVYRFDSDNIYVVDEAETDMSNKFLGFL